MGRKFYNMVKALAEKIGCYPHDLLAVFYQECTFNPKLVNDIGAAGLLQFLPSTLAGMGYKGTSQTFAALSAWEHMPYVERYLVANAQRYGELDTFERLYRAVLYPVSLTYGETDDTVIFAEGSREFEANKGLDIDGDDKVTIRDLKIKRAQIEASSMFQRYLTEMFFENPVYAPDVIAEVALRYVDVGNHLDQERYLEVMCGPGDTDAAIRSYMASGPSTCALFARGVWRLAGVVSPVLEARYRIGAAVSDIVEIASKSNAWHPSPTEFLKKGDVVLVASPEHVVVCISDPREMSPTSFEIDTVEGGQAPNSSYVRRFARGLEIRNGVMYTRGSNARRVIGRVDACELLPPPPHGDAA